MHACLVQLCIYIFEKFLIKSKALVQLINLFDNHVTT